MVSKEERLDRLVELYNQGMIQKEIGKELGISLAAVSRLLVRARDVGRLPPKEPTKPQSVVNGELKKYSANRGTISQMLLRMPPQARAWAMKNTPEGATISDFAASILLDAYYDETGE